MSNKDNGGPAFPDPGRAQSAKQREQLTDTGMTLRDYLIAHLGDENQSGSDADYGDYVKEALVGRPCPSGKVDGWVAVLTFEAEFRAKWRVMRADAMLEARQP